MSAQAVLTWVVIPALLALAIVVFALIGRLLIDPASKPSPAAEFRFLGAAAAVVMVLVVLALVLLLP